MDLGELFESMFEGLMGFVSILLIIIFLSVGYCVYSFFKDDKFEVNKPIVPEMKLVVKDNVIDTVYVYNFE